MKGTTLYVSLEDTASRLQERLLSVTDEAPNVFFTTFSFKIGEGLEEQIKSFVTDHPETALIVIDTFQMIRSTGSEVSYASDYNEIEVIKKLAEELKITILLVHHLRKQGDSDPFNMLSGTNGLAGGVDTLFVLDKSKRCSTNATLYCSGRDIEDREIELSFDGATLGACLEHTGLGAATQKQTDGAEKDALTRTCLAGDDRKAALELGVEFAYQSVILYGE